MDNWTFNEEMLGFRSYELLIDELRNCAISVILAEGHEELYSEYLKLNVLCAKVYMLGFKSVFED